MNKLNKEYLESKIKYKEFLEHTTPSNQILRWCVLTLESGFAVTGDPSACVDPSNDNEAIGKQIAYENSFNKLWQLEGYLLKQKLNQHKEYEKTTQG